MDISTYESLVGLVNRGFAKGDGNWGKKGFIEDDPPGAMRYTNIMAQKGMNDIVTEFLDFVPWEEIEYAKEPLYFANPIPIGLVGSDFITGIGVDTIKCPRYKSEDLFTRLISLLNGEVPKTIIPNIPDCDITEESPGEFERILTTGEGNIKIAPKISTYYDYMVIHGRSPLKGFGPLIKFNNKHKEQNKQEYFDFVDLSGTKNPIEVQIYPTKSGQINRDFINTIWQKISQKVSVINNFIDENDKVKTFGIDELLIKSYDNWKSTHLIKLNDDHRRCSNKIFELDVVQVVRDIMQYNSCKKIDDVITAFIPHQKSFPQISTDNIKTVIGKYNIKTLIEKDLNQQEHKTELKSIQTNINNINQISLDRIKGYIK